MVSSSSTTKFAARNFLPHSNHQHPHSLQLQQLPMLHIFIIHTYPSAFTGPRWLYVMVKLAKASLVSLPLAHIWTRNTRVLSLPLILLSCHQSQGAQGTPKHIFQRSTWKKVMVRLAYLILGELWYVIHCSVRLYLRVEVIDDGSETEEGNFQRFQEELRNTAETPCSLS